MLTLDIQTIKTLEQVKIPKRENQIKYKARQRKITHIQRKRKSKSAALLDDSDDYEDMDESGNKGENLKITMNCLMIFLKCKF